MTLTAWRSLDARMAQLREAVERPEWMIEAACRGLDPEDFFPHKGEKDKVRKAKAICAECPVRKECGEWGAYEKFGIWGGETERARRAIRQQGRSFT